MDNENEPSASPMVVAVCAYQLENVAKHFRHNIAQLAGDDYLVLLDRPKSDEAEAVADEVRAAGGRMYVLGVNNGLSASRNIVLTEHPRHHVLFVDDDVQLDAAAVNAVRACLRSGTHITGTRLVPPPDLERLPWYLTSGQFHLVGWHARPAAIKIWGASMGVDSAFAGEHGLRFDPTLSRTGGNLQSGEDTSFIRRMKEAGARERLLPDVAVIHDVDRNRLRLRYLLRRAYWQGRSEVRRRATVAGLRKELARHRRSPEAPARAPLMVLMYGGATVLGVIHEHWLRLRSSQ